MKRITDSDTLRLRIDPLTRRYVVQTGGGTWSHYAHSDDLAVARTAHRKAGRTGYRARIVDIRTLEVVA